MTRAILYTRVSTLSQADEGVSMEAQAATLSAYCAMRGLEVAEMVCDAGVSAGKPLSERPGGRRLLAAVEAGTVAHVVVYKLDRAFRNAADCLHVTQEWDRRGVALHLVDLGGQACDTTSATGRFFLSILAAMAEMERALTVERTVAALAFKKAKGELTGTAPFGSQVGTDGRTLEPSPSEMDVVRLILLLRRQRWSEEQIAKRLNEEAVPARGAKWYRTSVRRVIQRHGGTDNENHQQDRPAAP